MPVGTAQLSELRDHLENILSILAGNSYIDSTTELRDINEAYRLTSLRYDWTSLLTRVGIVKVANLDRYSIPSNFRKARTVKLDGKVIPPTELEFLKHSRYGHFIDQTQDDIIVRPIPTAASTAYTLSNAESAGNAVTIELDTVSGLSQHDEIWIDSVSGTDEFTLVSSVGTLLITARLDAAKSASDILYRANDIIDIQYYRTITLLSADSDTTLLPPSVDFIMLHAAAAMLYERIEDFVKAEKHWNIWKERLGEVWLALDKTHTGAATTFSIG